MELTKEVHEGQSAYTRWGLTYYRFFVLGFSNRLGWRCSTPRLLRSYDRHVSANHLDVGVGTGYYVANCRYPSGSPRLALMDLNENSLAYAAAAARAHRPETYRRNVLEPITGVPEKFDSIGVTYLLHCLPGTIAEKSVVFDHLAPLLNEDGVLFGATVVADGRHNAIARWLQRAYNERGHFHNASDTLRGLEGALRSRFQEVGVERVGSVALFHARKPVDATTTGAATAAGATTAARPSHTNGDK
ncbi:class I SAM-dependent methyltransferase [Streptomyces sp. NPDC001793]|uniref:class I SAM-dependent methyltransferase n=1 Tax=Streptomyces sp. NPDC001793 TaxID=3154657 RepID=UPI00331D5065